MSWSERRKSELPLLNDSGSDLFRNLLPIGSCQCQLSFRRIGKKPAFNENRRQPALAKHVIFGRAGPTVLRADAINNLLLNARGEHCTAIAFGVGLNTVRATSRRGIIVDADEDCVAFRVGDRASHRPKMNSRLVLVPLSPQRRRPPPQPKFFERGWTFRAL